MVQILTEIDQKEQHNPWIFVYIHDKVINEKGCHILVLDEKPGILVNSFTVILWEVAGCSLVVVTAMHFCCPGSALMVFLAAL